MRFTGSILVPAGVKQLQSILPLLIGFALLLLSWPRPIQRYSLPPLSGSREIVSLRLNHTVGSPIFANYFWVSDDELLYLDAENTPAKLIRHNVKTGAQASYSVPSIRGIMDSFRYQNGVTLSPDGRWLLVYLRNPYPRSDQVAIVPASSPATPVQASRRWSVGKSYSVFWLPDSQHFVSFHPIRKPGIYDAVIYDADVFSDRQTYRFSTVLNQSYLRNAAMTPEGRGFIITNPHPNYLQVEEYPVFEQNRTPIVRRLPRDSASVYWRYVRSISPDGKRVLWTVMSEENLFVSAILPMKQWLPGPIEILQRYFGKSGEYIWVTDRNGDHAKTIGRTRYRYFSGWQALDYNDGMEDIRWTPDGKHMSFVYNNKLYVRPVP